jgi:hypothetical protein
MARQRAKLFAGEVPAALTSRQFATLRGRILRFSEKVEKVLKTQEAQPA